MVQASSSTSSNSPLNLGNRIATAVQAKTMQAARQQGAAAVELIESAAEMTTDTSNAPDTLSPGDSLVARATGLGTLLDVTA